MVLPALLALVVPLVPCASPVEVPAQDTAVHTRFLWADANADGRVDALVLRADGAVRYLVGCDGPRFEDRTLSLGLNDVGAVRFAAWGDVEGDGRLELALVGTNGRVRIFGADPSGVFWDLSDAAGLPAHADITSLEWIDFDADGAADLLLRGAFDERLVRGDGTGLFVAVELGLESHAPSSVSLLPSGSTPITTPVANLAAGISVESPRAKSALPSPSAGALGARRPANGSGLPGNPQPEPSIAPDEVAAGSSERLPACVAAVRDIATGGCLKASSVPALGRLFPLGTEFFVDASSGHVGIGTLTPVTPLEVAGRSTLDGDLSVGGGPGRLEVKVESGDGPDLNLRDENGDPLVSLSTQASGGRLQISDDAGSQRVDLSASSGAPTFLDFIDQNGVYSGQFLADGGGELSLRDGNAIEQVHLEGAGASGGGELTLFRGAGSERLSARADANGGTLELANASGLPLVSVRSTFNGGRLQISDLISQRVDLSAVEGSPTFLDIVDQNGVYGGQLSANGGGELSLRGANGAEYTRLMGAGLSGGGELRLMHATGVQSARLAGGGGATGGSLLLENTSGQSSVSIFDTATGAEARLSDSTGAERLNLNVTPFTGGQAIFRAVDGTAGVVIDGNGPSDGGRISLTADAGATTVMLEGDDGTNAGSLEVRAATGTATFEVEGGVGGASRLTLRETDSSKALEFSGNRLRLFDVNALTTLAFDRKLGAIGIGTEVMEAPLHVMEGSAGAVTANSNSIAVFERSTGGFVSVLGPNGSSKGILFGRTSDNDSGGIIYDQSSVSNESMQFRTGGNSTKMTIGSTGKVGIGTTAPSFLLHVNGSAGKPGGGSWSVASDARLKRDVRDLESALERLLKLRGVTFEYIDPASIAELDGRRTGMIAQEVERVFPDWVAENPDGFKRLTIRGFEALAVEALRELREEKDREIAALEERLARLESRSIHD